MIVMRAGGWWNSGSYCGSRARGGEVSRSAKDVNRGCREF